MAQPVVSPTIPSTDGRVASRMWHTFSDMNAVQAGPKFVVSEGSGVWLWDDQGDRYLDGTASLWYCNVGHGREEIAEAVRTQLLRLDAYTVYGDFANEPALELSERLAGLAPVDDPRVILTCGGGESIETAAKIARQYWSIRGQSDRVHLISRTGGYHGLHGIGTSVIGMDRFRNGYGPMVEATSVVPHDSVAALEAEIHRVGPEKVAAFFAEPVIGAGGVYAPTDGYFREVAELCRRYGILFISDSVICGFGRMGNWFGMERFGVRPDMIVFAKGVSSGYLPLGGVVVSGEIAEPFWEHPGHTLLHGTTYAGHPTCCVAALANLDILERENLLSGSMQVEQDLDRSLRTLESHPAVGEVRSGTGVMGAVELSAEAQANGVNAAEVFREARRRGVILRAIPGTLLASPPLIITPDQIEHMVATLRASLDAVTERVA